MEITKEQIEKMLNFFFDVRAHLMLGKPIKINDIDADSDLVYGVCQKIMEIWNFDEWVWELFDQYTIERYEELKYK